MIRFLITFFVVYVLLMAPWPGVRDGYRDLFVGVGASVFGPLGPGNEAAFEKYDHEDDPADVTINVRHRQTGGTLWMRLNSREVAYFPTAVIMALTLATPARWGRRLRSLVIGLAGVGGFILGRLLIIILVYSARDLASMSGVPTFWDKAWNAGIHFVGAGHALSYIVPVIVWALVCVRREHVALVFAVPQSQSVRKPKPVSRSAKKG